MYETHPFLKGNTYTIYHLEKTARSIHFVLARVFCLHFPINLLLAPIHFPGIFSTCPSSLAAHILLVRVTQWMFPLSEHAQIS